VRRGGRKLHRDELHNLYSSLNTEVAKSKRLRQDEHILLMIETCIWQIILSGHANWKNNLDEVCVDGITALESVSSKYVLRTYDKLKWLRTVQSPNEPL
jgi:hypothetical protein